ncbi:alanine--tRNA ligase [Virgibacillus pantothenticus]|uniref:Alanine--tRNA ligase n=1 Tax=Virgibacillus pantothenticus TaxID=1473 RepID=A0A0L0QPU4_VIRPA|nr:MULTISPECIES: alanine--tRNA ligase [Virgibacillus]API90630.1 alanine--tRNA ligase [Virgibacillus sp. 6R]KNE20584.1 alanine--tRNA ligase [Virgibacillus pantothenticus]MBS7429748.1 alanine--tRNA ligase [Virgibacillus sp. 19R1-5]MBU8565623.1 alanine--tRNA ligase [Virgibacillus pantothenticus]MBU8601295.1 alanine--tRNA ligase [Virgibacillus pantothenticus]
MKQLTSAEVRQMFLDFFKEKGHRVEPSASLVPKDDPTLLWINSGVATLKKYFDGRVIPENPRIVNAQKSIRTNDIENVGFTARHHTFFEMLGNFSIGDYFKQEAIEWAWEFLTSEHWIGFEADRLSVTVHPEDDEAYDIWLHTIGLPKERIIRLEENFWDIGEGPSGPNTEIFYDRGEKYGNNPNDPELYPGGENDRYLEIWNLVFSQFNHNPDDTYTPLPKKNIDTGLGLERMVSVIQDVPTNFETDLFMPIIKKTETLASVKYGDSSSTDTAFKVIADHIRTVSFAIGDGAVPSNEGRGYVLRRLIRRAVRFAKEIGIEKPFMYELVDVVADIMQDFYVQVVEKKDFIRNMVKAEEEKFHETLHDGLDILTTIMSREKQRGSSIFPGYEVFRLYDTYGFPKELTEEYVQAQGFSIDEAGFQAEMDKQRERARKARQKVDSMQVQGGAIAEIDVASEFVGYTNTEQDTTVAAIIKDEQQVKQANAGEEVYLFLHQTPFYAESGGQIADQGTIHTEYAVGQVKDVQKSPKGQHVHRVRIEKGSISVGEMVTATVDVAKRSFVVKNHTATHLLHQALKDVIGEHVNQAGSLVAPERLRFDFSHYQAVSKQELAQIERQVNEKIWQAIPLQIKTEKLEEAKKMGATALFGEKYGDIVRVVQIGDYSIELCGGCHVVNTSEIGLFKIVTESGIGAGTRRIEAVTSKQAYEFITGKLGLLQQASQLVKAKDEAVPEKIEALYHEIKQLQKETESLQAKLANKETATMLEEVKTIDGVQVLAKKVEVQDMNQLRNMVDELKQKLDSGMILLAMENNNKVQLAAGVSKDLIEQGYHAGHLIKKAAQACGGGGGGRPDMAQAGGKDPSKIAEALHVAKLYIEEKRNH